MPTLQKRIDFHLVGWLGAAVLRAAWASWRVRAIDPEGVAQGIREGRRPVIVAFWHRHILTMLAHYREHRVCVPVSQSRDGEYVAQVMGRFGMASVRGSTSRGSLRVLKGLLARVREGWSPAITPDGPRGPKFSVQPGIALLARRSGLPVYPVGIAVRDAWLARSWDDFVMPKPWTRIVIAFGDALGTDQLRETDAFCERLKGALFSATEAAQTALRSC
ncbi:MAG: lysophospholipid acyltransferase family protein [Planctomycetota bacterium]|jgi:lysophospholipid acyltransferase (LPLAT)-like uncharacterized protein